MWFQYFAIHIMKTISGILTLISFLTGSLFGQVPDGFHDELVTDDFFAPVGIVFPDSNLAYVWEQDGKVHVLENGVKLTPPLLDISEEVTSSGDNGMIGLALDPAFSENGYIYVSYVVSPHYLLFYGTLEYDPIYSNTRAATIGRVTRYQVDTNTFLSVNPESRKILLGDSIHNGIPVLAPAHGVGGLDFGTDGTLLVGTGDGTTWVGDHAGGEEYQKFGYDSLGKELGIIDQAQDVGSLRSQQIESYNGKILRIDPQTGLGIPSNPFYDSLQPDAAQSKVWAMGLRSPFRIRVRPGSGSFDPEDGNPGVLYIGDVGSNQFEELNVASGPGRNFGWPLYEGQRINDGYYDQWVENPYAVIDQNSSNCSFTHFRFNDLIRDPRKDHSLDRSHPCEDLKEIPSEQPVFVHERPLIAYGNTKNNPELTEIPAFTTAGTATYHEINDPTSPIQALPFDGISSVAGDFYQGLSFPESYRRNYFHADFSGWIKSMAYDVHDTDEIHSISDFKEGGFYVVYLRFNPFEDALYYVVLDYSGSENVYQLRKITYGGNPGPSALIETNKTYGPSPLEVNFFGSSSFDPAGESITYQWDFGNYGQSNQQDTSLIFETSEDTPQNIEVTLIVADEVLQTDSATQVISINNTPPQVSISSIPDEYYYRLDQGLIDLDLEGSVSDREHRDNELEYHWEIKLKHNDHFHIEFVDTNRISQVSLFPLGSTELDEHSYLITLTVTDPLGLSSSSSVEINPDLSTSTDQVNAESEIFFYPNPVGDVINIRLPKHENLYTNPALIIYDAMGQIVLHQNLGEDIQSHVRIDLDLPHGVYMATLKNNHEVIATQILLKQ